MRRTLFLSLAIMAVAGLMLAGCSGGGDGGDNGVAANLVGTWQVIAASVDGQMQVLADEMGWDEGTVRMDVQFRNDGTLMVRHYDQAGEETASEQGTWQVADGVLTVNVDQETNDLTYQIDGNTMQTTETDDGQQLLLTWVKVVQLSGHDNAMVGTFAVTETEVDGTDTDPADYFDISEQADGVRFMLEADGTFTFSEIGQQGAINQQQGTWATGGGEIIITIDGNTLRGVYTPDNTSITLLDPDGQTLAMELNPLEVPAQIDPALVATWQPYAATADGAVCAPAVAMNWGAGVVGATIQFFNDGTYEFTEALDGGSAQTATGVWGAEGGVFSILAGIEVERLAYTITGNLVETSFTKGATDYVVWWAKVVDLTGHDAQMVGTWTLDGIEVNGVGHPATDFFGSSPEVDAVTLQLLGDGTVAIHQLAGDEIVATETGTWATGGGQMTVTPAGQETVRGAYVVNNSSFTFLNDNGASVKFELSAFAPAGARDASVVGTWTMTSVTVNGQSAPMADFFEWDAGTDSMTIQFFADGTVISTEYAGDTINYADMGAWNTDGGTFTLTIGDPIVMDAWQITGDTATMTMTEEGDTVVLTLQRAV